MVNIYNQIILSTATGDDLTAVCKDFFGVNRKTATQSTGTIRFSGTNGTVVTSGTIISTDNGLQYLTIATGTVASGYVDIEAKSDDELAIKDGINKDDLILIPNNSKKPLSEGMRIHK